MSRLFSITGFWYTIQDNTIANTYQLEIIELRIHIYRTGTIEGRNNTQASYTGELKYHRETDGLLVLRVTGNLTYRHITGIRSVYRIVNT